jgi:altronate dehydratase large subunit
VRTLTGLGSNPNVGAALIVGLGCETIPADFVAGEIRKATNMPVEHLIIQEQGGSQKCARRGVEIAKQMLAETEKSAREECPWNRLVLGLECGGSDALSGVTANPVVGKAADWLVGQGGTAILTETTEMIGTEQVLSRRAATPELGQRIVNLITSQREKTERFLGEGASMVISPGNIEGGLSNITEKSLGCIVKGGTTPIREVVEYGVQPAEKGLVIMDAPGSDVFSLTGMAAGGAQLLIFTTGRGTPVGFPIAPVIKVASNSRLFENMNDDMDVNAGRVLEGVSMDQAGKELCQLMERVAGGEQTRAEINRQETLSFFTEGPAF